MARNRKTIMWTVAWAAVLGAVMALGGADAQDAAEEPFCHDGTVAAVAQQDGVLLSWPEQNQTIVHNIERKEADGNDTFQQIGQAPSSETEFLDDTADPGTTYTYRVEVKTHTPAQPGSASAYFCDEPTVTAIPFFPTLLAAGFAGVVATGAYVWAKR